MHPKLLPLDNVSHMNVQHTEVQIVLNSIAMNRHTLLFCAISFCFHILSKRTRNFQILLSQKVHASNRRDRIIYGTIGTIGIAVICFVCEVNKLNNTLCIIIFNVECALGRYI